MPIFVPRYTPDYSRLAAIYTHGGQQLAELAMQRGANTAATLARLGELFSGYQATNRERADRAAALALRERERAEERTEKQKDRDERAAERKADKEARERTEERAAARYAVDQTAPGPVSNALADFARRFPETAARFSSRTTLPARVTPGAMGEIEAGPDQFSVLEPNADQIERSRAFQAQQAARDAQAAAQKIDDERADRALNQQTAYQNASLEIQRQQAATAAKNANARLGVSSELPAKYRNPLERAIGSLPANRRGPKITHAQRLLDEGNEKELRDFIRQTAVEGENVDTKNQVLGRMATIASLVDTRDILNELKAKGVNTNIVSGTWEDFLRKIGTTGNPELVALSNRLAGTLINYRRAATGAAFGEREGSAYEKMFPNYRNEPPVNLALIDGLMREMTTYDRVYWDHKLGPDGSTAILGENYGIPTNVLPPPGMMPGGPRPTIVSITPVRPRQ